MTILYKRRTDGQIVAVVEAEVGLTFAGGLTLAGNLDLGGNKFKLDTDLYFDARTATIARIATDSGTLRDLELRYAYFSFMQASGSIGKIRAPSGNNRTILFEAGLNGVLTEVARMTSHATAPNFAISCAGDINVLTGKTVTITDLGGAGDRYVYVDNNGVLQQGAAYP